MQGGGAGDRGRILLYVTLFTTIHPRVGQGELGVLLKWLGGRQVTAASTVTPLLWQAPSRDMDLQTLYGYGSHL